MMYEFVRSNQRKKRENGIEDVEGDRFKNFERDGIGNNKNSS